MAVEYCKELVALAEELDEITRQIDWILRVQSEEVEDGREPVGIHIAEHNLDCDYWDEDTALSFDPSKVISPMLKAMVGILAERRLAVKLELKAKLEEGIPLDGVEAEEVKKSAAWNPREVVTQFEGCEDGIYVVLQRSKLSEKGIQNHEVKLIEVRDGKLYDVGSGTRITLFADQCFEDLTFVRLEYRSSLRVATIRFEGKEEE